MRTFEELMKISEINQKIEQDINFNIKSDLLELRKQQEKPEVQNNISSNTNSKEIDSDSTVLSYFEQLKDIIDMRTEQAVIFAINSKKFTFSFYLDLKLKKENKLKKKQRKQLSEMIKNYINSYDYKVDVTTEKKGKIHVQGVVKDIEDNDKYILISGYGCYSEIYDFLFSFILLCIALSALGTLFYFLLTYFLLTFEIKIFIICISLTILLWFTAILKESVLDKLSYNEYVKTVNKYQLYYMLENRDKKTFFYFFKRNLKEFIKEIL